MHIPTRRTRSVRRRPSGMTLIEVLVALLIFSFGLLGLVGLQARALRFSTSAEDTNRAALLASQMAFMINDTQQIDQATNNATGYTNWVALVSNTANGGLAGGVGTVTPSVATSSATITIQWRSTNAQAGDPLNRYVTQVVLP